MMTVISNIREHRLARTDDAAFSLGDVWSDCAVQRHIFHLSLDSDHCVVRFRRCSVPGVRLPYALTLTTAYNTPDTRVPRRNFVVVPSRLSRWLRQFRNTAASEVQVRHVGHLHLFSRLERWRLLTPQPRHTTHTCRCLSAESR